MLKAISDRIIVRLENKENKEILIKNTDNYTNVGIIESIGERVVGLKVGDKIAFHCFDELPLNEKNLVVIRQKSLLGIYE